MELQTPEKIIKESIPKLHFKNQDVLNSEFDRELRNQNLFKAMILGNTYKKKVTIVFETADGPKMVETTVWASTERDILLKNGINIPIRSILEIKAA